MFAGNFSSTTTTPRGPGGCLTLCAASHHACDQPKREHQQQQQHQPRAQPKGLRRGVSDLVCVGKEGEASLPIARKPSTQSRAAFEISPRQSESHSTHAQGTHKQRVVEEARVNGGQRATPFSSRPSRLNPPACRFPPRCQLPQPDQHKRLHPRPLHARVTLLPRISLPDRTAASQSFNPSCQGASCTQYLFKLLAAAAARAPA